MELKFEDGQFILTGNAADMNAILTAAWKQLHGENPARFGTTNNPIEKLVVVGSYASQAVMSHPTIDAQSMLTHSMYNPDTFYSGD